MSLVKRCTLRGWTYIGDLVPVLVRPFLGGKLVVPFLLILARESRIGDLTPGSKSKFHSFQ